MEKVYLDYAKILKALSDANRLKIIDILSCGEKCACDILDHFDFTQPTLSHHMKILAECGLVEVRKDGLWNYYSLNQDKGMDLVNTVSGIMNPKSHCICHHSSQQVCDK